jgi:Skp family chaperone for outer membrane proteins
MRKILMVAAAVAAATVANAQEATKGPKIAVIDLDRVTQDSLLGKSYAQQMEGLSKDITAMENEIEAERNKKRTELQKMENDIKAMTDDLEKQSPLLSEDAAEKKRQEIVKKGRDREAFVEDGRADLERMQQKLARIQQDAQNKAQNLNVEFRQKLQPYMDAVAKAQGIDILLDSRYAQVINKSYDISNEVIVKCDDAERANPSAKKPAAAAPAPAPKPTAAPATPKK